MCKLDTVAVSSASVAKDDIHRVPGSTRSCSAANNPCALAGCPDSSTSKDSTSAVELQRVCTNCGTDECPARTWRAGPAGPKTLCNACGIRYKRRGAGGLILGSRAANAAASELAAGRDSQRVTTQPLLERVSSAGSNIAAQTNIASSSAAPAAGPKKSMISSETSNNLGAAAPAVQPRPTQRPVFKAAKQVVEPIRKSQRMKRARVMFNASDFVQPARTVRAKPSALPPAVSAAATEGSMSRRPLRQKRPRDLADELECLQPGRTTRARVTSSSAEAATSESVQQASAAGAVELNVSEIDIRAETKEVLSTVAPGAAFVRSRRSYWVAEREESRLCEALRARARARTTAAAEAEQAAEALLAMGRCCWLDGLIAAVGLEVDGF